MVGGPHLVTVLTPGILAHGNAPVGGVAFHHLLPALVVAGAITTGLAGLAAAHRTGRTRVLQAASDLSERVSGTPGWAALPAAIAGVSLVVAVFGFYWDVASHIDRGRDVGPFANPSHYPILAGLVGLVVAGVVSVTLGTERTHPTAVRIAERWRAPVGGLLMLLCAAVAVAGFPLDDLWHRIFGQDVTLWSPTHIQMVAGASLVPLALWVLAAEIHHSPRLRREDPTRMFAVRLVEVALAGAFLVGLSTLQAEFDYGFPQFRLVYQPVLVMLAAGIGLVAARIRLGRGGALLAAVFFLVVRGYLSVAIDASLDHLALRLPLYLPEAVLVEVVALRVGRERQVSLGGWAGLAVGTVGLAAEWGWSHLWMPIPWPASLLPEAVALGLPAAVAGGLLGGLVGRCLTPPGVARQRVPAGLAAAAGLVAVGVLAYPLPRSGMAGVHAQVALAEVRSAPARTVEATVTVRPAEAVAGADWFMAVAWQGAGLTDGPSVVAPLTSVGPATWRTTRPLPVHGQWKAMIRLHRDAAMVAAPVHIPADPATAVDGLPAEERFVRPFLPETTLLALAATGAPRWVAVVAHGLLLLIAVAWVGAFTAGLWHLTSRTARTSAPGGPAPGRRPALAVPAAR